MFNSNRSRMFWYFGPEDFQEDKNIWRQFLNLFVEYQKILE